MSATMKAYAVQMHLHGSMSEGPASCLAHEFMAAETGAVDVIWWTDHDFRVSNFAKLRSCPLDALEEYVQIPNRQPTPDQPTVPAQVTWKPVGDRPTDGTALSASDSVVHSGAGSLRLELSEALPDLAGQERRSLYELQVGAHYEAFPLLTRPTVRLAIYPERGVGELGSVFVQLVLSQQPPDLAQPSLTYVLGGPAAGGNGGADRGTDLGHGRRAMVVGGQATISCPYSPGAWNELELDPAEDVERLGLPGGMDNSLHRLRIGTASAGPQVVAYFDSLEVETKFRGPTVLEMHRQLLHALPTRVPHLVGLEVSYYGRHITAFGSAVPIPDYEGLLPKALSPEQVVEHIHRHGGLACVAHPPRVDLDGTAANLAKRRLYGADLMEVAHSGAGLPDRLQLWDRLARHGIVVTDLGVSDAHSAAQGWRATEQQPCHWVTRIWADSPEEADLLEALRRGHVFFADPSAFRGTLDLSGPGDASMGDVLVVAGRPPALTAHLSGLQQGDLIAWFCNGYLVHAATVGERDPAVESAVNWRPQAPVERLQAIRVQVHRPSLANGAFGGLIACSNPVYLTSAAAGLPETTHRVLDVG